MGGILSSDASSAAVLTEAEPHAEGTVLAVDDTPDKLQFLEVLLRQSGYRVLTASEGREALKLALGERPDLIISDVAMPVMDGIELCRRVRADSRLSAVPVLLVSAMRKDSESVIEGLRAGADDYLEAPYDPVHLIAKAARLVERAAVEEHYREIVEQAADIIYTRDVRGYVTSINEAGERFFGRPREELIGKHVGELLGVSDPEGFVSVAVEELRQSGRWRRQVEATDHSGDSRWLDMSRSLVRDRRGEVVGVRAVARDITEQKQAEEERERFFAVSADLLLIAGFDGYFKWLSPAWERALGWTSEELTSKPWLHFVHPEDQEITVAEAEKLFAGREAVAFENRYRHKDGSYRWISWRVRPYLEEHLLYGAATDVTERKQLEEQYRQSQKLESVGQLAGGIAHDFNNLLTVISGYGELMLRRVGRDDPLRRNLEEIKKAAERASSLTRQLLAFSRKQVLQPKVIDLTATVVNMDRMLQRLIGEDIQLVTLLDPGLEKVKADPGQIEQALMNLAVNARDAMPGGGKLTVETRNVYLDKAYARRHVSVTPGRYVMLAVSDTGTGMDAETQARIFEPFFTTKGPGKGTGLGLSMVYGIVRQSSGNIWVYSEPGHGTTFKVYLPVVYEEGESRDEGVAPGRARGTETVLLVEDEEAVRRLLLDILESEGYTVLKAANGHEALEVCERHEGPIHLLMTDVVMPGMSGRQLVERMAEKCGDAKVLFMSGYTDNAIVHHGVLDAGTNFLQKPFTPDDVARKVREVLDGP
jgi:two-component system cell cycle sensor histidine kinase/response regulator CckA